MERRDVVYIHHYPQDLAPMLFALHNDPFFPALCEQMVLGSCVAVVHLRWRFSDRLQPSTSDIHSPDIERP
jgi:hypothetical protein